MRKKGRKHSESTEPKVISSLHGVEKPLWSKCQTHFSEVLHTANSNSASLHSSDGFETGDLQALDPQHIGSFLAPGDPEAPCSHHNPHHPHLSLRNSLLPLWYFLTSAMSPSACMLTASEKPRVIHDHYNASSTVAVTRTLHGFGGHAGFMQTIERHHPINIRGEALN